MNKETTAKVISVSKQKWIKINTKPIRKNSSDSAIYPHIIKITTYEGKSQEDGQVIYYDIRNGKHVENLDQKQGKRVDDQDIKGLTKQEQQQIITKTNFIYRGGLENLMGIDIEQGYR